MKHVIAIDKFNTIAFLYCNKSRAHAVPDDFHPLHAGTPVRQALSFSRNQGNRDRISLRAVVRIKHTLIVNHNRAPDLGGFERLKAGTQAQQGNYCINYRFLHYECRSATCICIQYSGLRLIGIECDLIRSVSTKQQPDSLEQLRQQLAAFADERDWQQFHSPKNLAMALIAEAAELVEHFQWLTEEQSRRLDSGKKTAVRLELADILIYLIRTADQLDIDLVASALDKIKINEQRYPVDKVRGKALRAGEYD